MHISIIAHTTKVGHTQVFLKEEGLERLRRAIRTEYAHNATVIQGFARRCATRALVKRRTHAATVLQKVLVAFLR